MNVDQIKNELKKSFSEFDEKWTVYEELYVNELMIIEREARQYITNAVELEERLTELECKK